MFDILIVQYLHPTHSTNTIETIFTLLERCVGRMVHTPMELNCVPSYGLTGKLLVMGQFHNDVTKS